MPGYCPVAERLAKHSIPEPNTGCVLWTASLTKYGYGQIGIGRDMKRAHRVAYELAKGPIPQGLEIDHLCRVRSCINPDHLEAVTKRENILRGYGTHAIHARATHCPKGHPLIEGNLYRAPGLKRGRGQCLTCQRKPPELCETPEQRKARNSTMSNRRWAKWRDARRGMTHCKNGHELTEANIYVGPTGTQWCRQCRRDYMRAFKARRRACQHSSKTA